MTAYHVFCCSKKTAGFYLIVVEETASARKTCSSLGSSYHTHTQIICEYKRMTRTSCVSSKSLRKWSLLRSCSCEMCSLKSCSFSSLLRGSATLQRWSLRSARLVSFHVASALRTLMHTHCRRKNSQDELTSLWKKRERLKSPIFAKLL